MKKAISYLILAGMFISSCKKDHVTKEDTTPHKVTFNLSGFTQTANSAGGKKINAVGTNATTVPIIKFLYYKAYKITPAFGNNIPESFQLAREIFQDSTSANLGTITDDLPAGQYIFYFYGGETGSSLVGRIAFKDDKYKFWPDAFAQKLTLTIGDGDINENVVMERIVSQIKVKITDTIPNKLHAIKIDTKPDYNYYSLDNLFPFGNGKYPFIDPDDNTLYVGSKEKQTRSKTYIIPDSLKGKANYTQLFNVVLSSPNMEVTISGYDSSNRLITQRKVSNVVTTANTQTLLSGNLFGPGSNFTIQLNQAWGTPVNIDF